MQNIFLLNFCIRVELREKVKIRHCYYYSSDYRLQTTVLLLTYNKLYFKPYEFLPYKEIFTTVYSIS